MLKQGKEFNDMCELRSLNSRITGDRDVLGAQDRGATQDSLNFTD